MAVIAVFYVLGRAVAGDALTAGRYRLRPLDDHSPGVPMCRRRPRHFVAG